MSVGINLLEIYAIASTEYDLLNRSYRWVINSLKLASRVLISYLC